MGAEPQALFKVMDLAPFDYEEFYPINIAAIASSIILVVNNNRPWKTMKELVEHVQKNPNSVKQYLAGTGTVPFTVNAMINAVTKFPTTNVPFDGDGPAIAALQGGHVDIGFIASGAVIEHVRAGRLRALAVLQTTPFQGIPRLPRPFRRSRSSYPGALGTASSFGRKRPTRSRRGSSMPSRRPDRTRKYVELMEGRGTTMLNLSGAEAEAFIRKWRSTTAWLYQDAGVAQEGPGLSRHSAALTGRHGPPSTSCPPPTPSGVGIAHACPKGAPMDSPPRHRMPGETVFVSALLMLSLFLFWTAFKISGFKSLSSAGAYPMAATATMVVCAIIILLDAVRKPAMALLDGENAIEAFCKGHHTDHGHRLFVGDHLLHAGP